MFTSGKKCSVQEESFGLATLAGGGWEVVIKGVRTHTTTTSQKKPRIAMMTFSRYRDFPKTFFTVNTPQTLSIRCSSNNTCAGNPDDIHPAATYTDNKIKRGLSGHCSPTNSWATLWTCTHTHTHRTWVSIRKFWNENLQVVGTAVPIQLTGGIESARHVSRGFH